MKIADLQCVVNLTAKFLKLRCRPKVELHDSDRGMAVKLKNRCIILLPEKILGKSATYCTYYAVHEVCHFIDGFTNHGRKFRANEDRALAFWGISIKRKGAYPVDIRGATGRIFPV